MKYQIKYLEFSQNRQPFLIASMTFKCIDTFSKVLVYDIDQGGYQRKPEPKHYNKIRDYILADINSFILPTSIVLGLDSTMLKSINKGNGLLELDSIKITDSIFRIVDGQHRIYGLREASRKNTVINDYELPVIIVITSENRRSLELEIFKDINSKAKRVKVDLIKLAAYDYRLREKNIKEDNIVEHISTKTAFILKENNEESVWHSAIKFDIHSELIFGIIGVSSFMESIENIVKIYLKNNQIDLTANHEAILRKVNSASENISKFLFSCWDEIIKSKWPDAFDNKQIEMDIDEELKVYYYKKDYYIQKTFGVKALNGVIGDLYRTNNGNDKKTITDLKTRLGASKIKNDDWKVGGPFSGFSSESGVNKVKKMI